MTREHWFLKYIKERKKLISVHRIYDTGIELSIASRQMGNKRLSEYEREHYIAQVKAAVENFTPQIESKFGLNIVGNTELNQLKSLEIKNIRDCEAAGNKIQAIGENLMNQNKHSSFWIQPMKFLNTTYFTFGEFATMAILFSLVIGILHYL